MKNDLRVIEEGQLLLLKSGEFVYVMSVDPESKSGGDAVRNCDCRLAYKHKKGDELRKNGMWVGIIEDARNNQSISVDISKIKSFTIAELYPMVATCFGKLSEEKMKLFRRIASDYYDNQGW